ncbi:MAG: DNA recombination protein RmuC [Planctomycetes bacterium]|nr:DNA recombination protein RmuC [Planctomycetota bacterium]
MEQMLHFITLVIGLAVGCLATWLVWRGRAHHAYDRGRGDAATERTALEERLKGMQQASEELKGRLRDAEQKSDGYRDAITGLEAEKSRLEETIVQQDRQLREKLALLNEATQKLGDAFKALAAEALKSNNQSFLQLAKENLEKFQQAAQGDLDKRQQAIDELVKPVKESLDKVDTKIQELEKAREGAYQGLKEQVKSLLESQKELRSETTNLVRALRRPQVRGRWGEIQLRRVVEMAGMLSHCDFFEQQTTDTEEGRLRPDLLVRLPAGKNIVVDAKAPLDAYLDAIETPDEEVRSAKLRDHARRVREHISALGKKSYFSQFDPAPEFVVLFLPGEVFFSAALEHDPALIEMGVEQNVIIATPTTLISLLRAVAYGWRQEQIAQNAKEISELGQELYKRLADMGKHMAKLGKSLQSANEAYNKAVGTMESRVLVSARRFKELGSTSAASELEGLDPIETTPRQLQAPELAPSGIELQSSSEEEHE